ncbi:MAG: hypothetical protein KDB63_00180 [Nocardioidaceae bacterium]|nr:hypothetical protein [Nocardioidaceae bacterium]
MNTKTKVSLGIAAAAAAIVGPFALMAAAQPGPILGQGSGPAAAAAMWGGNGAAADDTQGGWGMRGRGGMTNGAGNGAGMMNGAGYGAGMMADYLADELGVSADDVTAAMRQYHLDNPDAAIGRPASAEDAETRHDAMADYLAQALGVSADDVETALDAHMAGGCWD